METRSDSALIYWESYGSGDALVLLHGNGEDMTSFSAQKEFFSSYFRVILIDSRGHGKSTSGANQLSLYDMAKDVVAVLKDAGESKAHILGFSDGGNVAMILAARYPEVVNRLVLSGANCDPGGIRLRYSIPMRFAQSVASIQTVFSQEACRKKELLDLMVTQPKLKKADLALITAPTLVTAGEKDMLRRSHTEFLQRSIPEAELHWFPGSHFTPYEQPDSYNAVVLEFLHRNAK